MGRGSQRGCFSSGSKQEVRVRHGRGWDSPGHLRNRQRARALAHAQAAVPLTMLRVRAKEWKARPNIRERAGRSLGRSTSASSLTPLAPPSALTFRNGALRAAGNRPAGASHRWLRVSLPRATSRREEPGRWIPRATSEFDGTRISLPLIESPKTASASLSSVKCPPAVSRSFMIKGLGIFARSISSVQF